MGFQGHSAYTFLWTSQGLGHRTEGNSAAERQTALCFLHEHKQREARMSIMESLWFSLPESLPGAWGTKWEGRLESSCNLFFWKVITPSGPSQSFTAQWHDITCLWNLSIYNMAWRVLFTQWQSRWFWSCPTRPWEKSQLFYCIKDCTSVNLHSIEKPSPVHISNR